MGCLPRSWRQAWMLAAGAMPLLLAACPGLQLFGPGSAATSPPAVAAPAATPTEVVGHFVDEPVATGTPGPAGASPTATPAPVATLRTGPFVLDITVQPKQATLGLRPPAGATPFMAFTVQLEVEITLSNGLKIRNAKWHAIDPGVADVDASGFVTAGTKPGETLIVATSPEGEASQSARVAVRTDSGLGILLE